MTNVSQNSYTKYLNDKKVAQNQFEYHRLRGLDFVKTHEKGIYSKNDFNTPNFNALQEQIIREKVFEKTQKIYPVRKDANFGRQSNEDKPRNTDRSQGWAYTARNKARKILSINNEHIGKHKFRTCNCGSAPVSNGQNISVGVNQEKGTFHYTNLQSCGSRWTCPVCASKLQHQDEKNIYYNMLIMKEMGYNMFFFTTTIPHNKDDSLSKNMKLLKSCFAGAKRCRNVQHEWESIKKDDVYEAIKELKNPTLLKDYQYYFEPGDEFSLKPRIITAVEITHGKNGWHTHYHGIYCIHKSQMNKEAATNFMHDISSNYAKQVIKKKSIKSTRMQRAVYNHSFDFEHIKWDKGSESKISHYLTKVSGAWGVTNEIAKGSTSKIKSKGISPFDMLQNDGYEWEFLNYATQTKGVNQINGRSFWIVKPLKDDQDILNDLEHTDQKICVIKKEHFSLVIKHNKENAFLNSFRNGLTEYLENVNGKSIMILDYNILPAPDILHKLIKKRPGELDQVKNGFLILK